MSAKRFRYGMPARTAAWVLGTCAVTGVLLVWMGVTGREGRLFPLGIPISGAPVVVLGLLPLAVVVLVVVQLARARRFGARELVISGDAIDAPIGPWAKETRRLERSAVTHVERTEVMGTKVVVMHHAGGRLSLSNRNVGEDGYAALEAWLAAR